MLTERYIEALLVDEDLADLVWEAWNAGLIPDDLAASAWCILVGRCSYKRIRHDLESGVFALRIRPYPVSTS